MLENDLLVDGISCLMMASTDDDAYIASHPAATACFKGDGSYVNDEGSASVHSVYIVQEESSPLCKDRVLSKTKLRRVQGCVEMGTKKYEWNLFI